MSTELTRNGWTRLKECGHDHYAGPLRLNDYEFIIVPEFDHYLKTSILKYNIYTKTWISIWKSDGRLRCVDHTAVLNQSKDKIYIFGSGGALIEIDLKTNKYMANYYTIRQELDDPSHVKLLFCNNQYHIIQLLEQRFMPSSTLTTQRLMTFTIMDQDEKKDDDNSNDNGDDEELKIAIISKKQLDNVPTVSGAFFSTHSKEVCILGHENKWCTNRVHSHIVDDIMMEQVVELPRYTTSILTMDGKYMIFMGNYKISVLNLDTKEFYGSSTSCPYDDEPMNAIIMNKDDRLVHGFIKHIFQKQCPMDIIQSIINWYGRYCIHLLVNGKYQSHWVIDLTQIC